MEDKKHELRSRSELIDRRQSLRFDLLEIRDEAARQKILDQISVLTVRITAIDTDDACQGRLL